MLLLIFSLDLQAQNQLAETITVKVAVVIQDPKIPYEDNKRLHEVFQTPGYSFQWHDPWKLMQVYRDTLFSASGGVIDYQIVKIYDEKRFFTRLKGEDELLDLPQVIDLLAEPEWKTLKEQGTSFDYNAFLKHYGFCKMRDQGEIDEVWVWTFPYGGMWESTFAGQDAFWLNSNPVEGTSCQDLLTVMGLNYERRMSLAMESYGHRVESVMRKVYGRWEPQAPDRNNWEIFTTYNNLRPGHAHVGNIHFPPNGLSDYDWDNQEEVITYADTWYDYPEINETRGETVNCEEWNCSHLGYMTWWYRHLPRYAGLNAEDGHLNNWWHYVVDYKEAIRREKTLREELN